MGNLCSIFHSKFKNLLKVIPSPRKAQLLDYILLGWQTSTYKLKGSDNKWFMKPYPDIVTDTGIPLSSVQRYIKELDDEGFIIRRQALYSRTNHTGTFEVKKATYIHVTDKLIALLKPVSISSGSESTKPANTIHNENQDKTQVKLSDQNEQQPVCTNSNINEGIDPLNLRGLYIRDLYSSSINNIIDKQPLKSVDNATAGRLIKQFETIQQLVLTEIKEEIPEEVKKLLLGTFYNLTFEQHKQFSSPKQIVAEYLFALINTEFYLPNIQCFKYRNNILSKLIRRNQWKTPKGFYNHFYLGQNFKDKNELRDLRWEQLKEKEKAPMKCESDAVVDERLIQIEHKILEKSTQIQQLTDSIYKLSDEGLIVNTREKIQVLRNELEDLWNTQYTLEQEMDCYLLNVERMCA